MTNPRSEPSGEDCDPLDNLEHGETKFVKHKWEMSVWNKPENDYVGRDRQHDDMQVRDAYIAGSKGNERVVVEVEAKVKKIDPDTKPAFQTEERFKHGYGGKDSRPSRYKDGIIATLIAGGVTLLGVGVEVYQSVVPDADVHPSVVPDADVHPLLEVVSSLAPVAILVMLFSVVLFYMTFDRPRWGRE